MPATTQATEFEDAGIVESDEFETLGAIEPPALLDVLSGIPKRVALQGGMAPAGGALRALGDLVRSDTMSDLGAKIHKAAEVETEESKPLGMSFGQGILDAGLTSAGTMAPALASAPAQIVGRGMALAATQTAFPRYSELRDAGFGGGRAAVHAGIDGVAELLGERIALPVLADATKGVRQKLVHFIFRDLVGEEATTVLQQANAMLSDRPDMTWKEFLHGMKMTALVTPIAAGAQTGIAVGAQSVRNAVSPAPTTLETIGVPAPTAEGEAKANPAPAPTQPTGVVLPPGPTPEGEAKANPAKPQGEPPADPTTPGVPPEAPWKPSDEWQEREGDDMDDPGSTGIIRSGQLVAEIFAADTAEGQYYGAQVLDPKTGQMVLLGSDFLSVEEAQQAAEKQLNISWPKPTNVDAQGFSVGSMFELTPEEMLAQKKMDPLLWNGIGAKVSRGGNFGPGKDNYYIVNGMPVPPNEVFQRLVDITGIDLRTDAGAMQAKYFSSVMEGLVQDPANWLDVSNSVNEYFDGKLQEISTMSQAREAATGVPTRIFMGEDDMVATAAMPNVTGPLPDTKSSFLLPSGKPSTDVVARQAKQVKVLVERLRRKYMPEDTVVLMPNPNLNPNSGGSAATRIRGRFELRLKIDPNKLEDSVQTALHEFGHIVVMRHFFQADPAIQAAILHQYLKYTSAVTKDTTLGEYMRSHLGYDRSIQDAAQITPLSKRSKFTRPEFVDYIMSFSEYLADQAAVYFLDRTVVKGKMAQFFDSLLARLSAIWYGEKIHFKENTVFFDWLDSLATNKVSARPPPTAANPPVTTGEAAAAPHKPTPIASKEQAEAMLKLRKKVLDALRKAGATEDDLEALGHGQSVTEFKFEEAYEMADKLGIPPETYMGKMSRVRTVDEMTLFREELNQLQVKVSDPDIQDASADRRQDIKGFSWLLQKTMTAVQVRKRFGKAVPGLTKFVNTLEKMFAYRSHWKERADLRLQDMKSMPRAERERVFEMLLEEDKTGEFLSTSTYSSTGQRIYTPTADAVKKYRLTALGVNLYSQMRGDFNAAIEEMEIQAIAEMERLYSAETAEGLAAMRKAVQELREEFAAMKSRPYVPHTRFGKYTVSVRDKDGKLEAFYQRETESAAKKLETQLRHLHPTQKVSRGKMTEEVQLLMGMPPQLIRSMKAQLNLNERQIREFEDLLKDLTNGASFVRRMKKRENIAGWESDAENLPRAYADYMSRFANYASRIRFNHVLSEATTEVRQQARNMAIAGQNTPEINDLANWLMRLHDYVNNPGSEMANWRSAATVWYLGFNVKSALVNSTSVPTMTYPYLAKRYGDTKALGTITQAYKDIARKYTKPTALSDEEHKMLEALKTSGFIDASFASELAGIREGGRLADQTALSKPQAALFGAKHYAMWLFHKVEVVNRMVTALAAYRLAKEGRGSAFDPNDPDGYDKAALEAAKIAIQDTQNENAQWNRAEFMRGKKSVLTMFMSYQQNVIYQMFGGDESWMRMLAIQLLVAGLMGLPFAKDLDDLIKFFSRKVFGSDMSAERAVRAFLEDSFVNPDWILRGGSHNSFLSGLDLQGSLSQGRVIPGIEALAMEGDFSDRFANAVGDVGGAGFSAIMDMLKVLSSKDPADWKSLSRLLPVAARQTVDGGLALGEGRFLDGKGREIAEASTKDAIAKMLGFQPTVVSTERGKRTAQRDTAEFWLTRRNYVMSLYDKAQQTNDTGWREKADEALRDFNEEAPDAGLRITAKQLRGSIEARAKARHRAENNLGPSATVQQTYERVGKLYD